MRIKKSVRSPHIMYGVMEHWQPESNRNKKTVTGFTSLHYDTQTHIVIFTCIPLKEHPKRYITQVHIKRIAFHTAVTNGLRINILKVSKFIHQLITH